jgi:uncharacterized protein YbjQ (UPF0145 family)
MSWWESFLGLTASQKAEAAIQKAAIKALEAGDIPPRARDRAERHANNPHAPFSSDLSVREFLLTKESGIEPISQVMGSSFNSVSLFGNYMGAWRFTGELEAVSKAQMQARKVAVERMLIEAKVLGASGVIGVRIHAKASNMGTRMTEFTAYGTAVRIPDYPKDREPFTCALNGQDFWQLYKAGYVPKAVVMGLCTYYIYTNWRASYQMTGLFGIAGNQEVDHYSQRFIEARKLAVRRLTQELQETGADGAIGMQIFHSIQKIVRSEENKSFDLLVSFSALGTAVDAGVPKEKSNRTICLNLSKGNRYSGLLVNLR